MSTLSVSVKRSGVVRVLRSSPILGPLAALLLAILFFSSQTDRFMSGTNLSLVVQQVMVVGALAIGQTIVILTSGIDLSCGMVMALSQVLMTDLAVNRGVPPLLAILLGMSVALGFGFLNGLLVTTVRLPPFIVTLGTYNIAFAAMIIYTTQTITDLPGIMTALGNTFKIGTTAITYGSVVLVALYLIMWFVLRSTIFGRFVYAVGDNPEAARLAGIPTTRLLIGVYMLAAFFYGIAALFFIARTGVGDPRAGENLNLEAITAVVLGGTSLFGGRGNILGTFIGALTVGVFRNGLQLMGVPSIYQVLITGVLVILAVSIDQLSRRGK
jgi:fructose transport system permease protein